MYRTRGHVRYSECASDNKIKISGIINYFQDCTTDNSERNGVGHAYLKAKNRAWILNSWQVEIKRRPEVSEEIEVSTWATGFKGVFGPRDFCMRTSEGEILAIAHTLWVYIDTETGRPVKPDEEDLVAYEVEEPLPLEQVSRKIKLPDGLQEVDTFPVRKYHIDTNNHVNNSQYVQMATEVLPEDFCVKKLRVEYKKAAVYGEFITLKYAKEEDCITVELCDSEGNSYAIVEFVGEN